MHSLLTYRGAVYPWQCDHIGHMNVTFYTAKFDEANWNFFAEVGITPSYLRRGDHGMAGVQQAISYKRELMAGDLVTVHSRLLEMRERSLRVIHEMRNVETDEVAATTELTAVHLDRRTRKACEFGPEIRAIGARLLQSAAD
jgi:acyl-CoA thioester hydrolase